METLDDLITRSGGAAYCLFASSDDPDMRYLTRFVTHDPVPVIKKPGEKPVMIIPVMEAERAERESVAQIITRQQAGYQEIIRDEKDPYRITASLIQRIVPGPVIVSPRFPLGLARALERNHQVIMDETAMISRMRAVKSIPEINLIATAQHAVEAAMERAVSLIRAAENRNGILFHDDHPLTSEQVKYTIHTTLLSQGCIGQDTIVACGEETSMPHCTGTGPLRSNQPIVIDIFPKHEASGYHADMTRTVSYGEPSRAVMDLYEAVSGAQELGESLVRAGVQGADCYQGVRDFFDEQGYQTGTDGFTHSLGHGIGLEVHELPSLSPIGEELQPGHVVTVEPGLYYRGVGGVRIENLGVVTDSGFNRMTEFSREMIL
jgi:Xaa-Pro aminopeptidase